MRWFKVYGRVGVGYMHVLWHFIWETKASVVLVSMGDPGPNACIHCGMTVLFNFLQFTIFPWEGAESKCREREGKKKKNMLFSKINF